MHSFILFCTLCIVALSHAQYTITYTGYTDNKCSAVNPAVTGQIFEKTCAPEYRRAPQSGKIVFINSQYLTSCDYSDLTCAESAKTICENYNNSVCYGSTSTSFSNKYSWTADGNGGWNITYASYFDTTCNAQELSGAIFYQKCSPEFQTAPQSGKITQITDNWLISCDYSDTTCQQQTVCENYTNNDCYASATTAFSNKYSWNRQATNAPSTAPSSNPTSAPTNPPTGGGDSNDYVITYTGYEDNTCSKVDDDVTGPIFAHKCAPEFRKAPQSGKIVYINQQYLTSCDYSDLACNTQTVCENYNNSVCYGSDNSEFSNKYSWTANPNGGFTITYASYSDKQCNKVDVSGQIFEGTCAEEFRAAPQSGMITYINDDFLVSCDYSDTECKNLILCESYNNSNCYASSVTSFSNTYSWVRKSSASSVAVCALLSIFALAFALF